VRGHPGSEGSRGGVIRGINGKISKSGVDRPLISFVRGGIALALLRAALGIAYVEDIIKNEQHETGIDSVFESRQVIKKT
jgi:hypothetical protein